MAVGCMTQCFRLWYSHDQMSVIVCRLQVLKITLDYWNFFVPDIFSSAAVIDANAAFAFAGPVPMANRRALYSGILSKLRQLCITRMAKPEEVRLGLMPSLHRPQSPRFRVLHTAPNPAIGTW